MHNIKIVGMLSVTAWRKMEHDRLRQDTAHAGNDRTGPKLLEHHEAKVVRFVIFSSHTHTPFWSAVPFHRQLLGLKIEEPGIAFQNTKFPRSLKKHKTYFKTVEIVPVSFGSDFIGIYVNSLFISIYYY